MGPRLRRLSGIDGLRAIAVTAVFVYHAEVSWLPGGFLGVDVFFVISGYLITSLLLTELAATGQVSLGRFWARRARRLLPALFVLLAVCLLVNETGAGAHSGLRGDAFASIFYVANWHFILAHESYFAQFGRPPLLRHLWSLAVEEQFYLVWPPLFVLGMRLRRRGLVPLLVTLAALGSSALTWALYRSGSNSSRVFYGTDTRAAPLLVGVLLAFLWKPDTLRTLRNRAGRRALDLLALAALGVLVAMFALLHDSDPLVYHGGFLLLALAAAPLLAAIVHPSSTLARLFDHPLPRGLGQRSYAIYLWHWPVLAFTRPGVDLHLAPALVLAVRVVATLFLADLSYRFVEQPIRHGALHRLRVRTPHLLAQPRTPFAVTLLALAALTGLAAAAPTSIGTLPPGITAAALARSTHDQTHLVLPARTQSHLAQHTPAPDARPPRSGTILAVGDSVLLGASTALEARLGPLLRIDAVISRQPAQTIDRLLAYRAHASLPQRVIVHIGDNGPVYWADWQRLHRALAGVPLVVIVNVRVNRNWQDEVDSELRQYIVHWPQATIADWYDTSSNRRLLSDGTHTTPAGAARLADLIARALRAPHRGGVTH